MDLADQGRIIDIIAVASQRGLCDHDGGTTAEKPASLTLQHHAQFGPDHQIHQQENQEKQGQVGQSVGPAIQGLAEAVQQQRVEELDGFRGGQTQG